MQGRWWLVFFHYNMIGRYSVTWWRQIVFDRKTNITRVELHQACLVQILWIKTCKQWNTVTIDEQFLYSQITSNQKNELSALCTTSTKILFQYLAKKLRAFQWKEIMHFEGKASKTLEHLTFETVLSEFWKWFKKTFETSKMIILSYVLVYWMQWIKHQYKKATLMEILLLLWK